MQDGRDVGGTHPVEAGDEGFGGLVGGGKGQAPDLRPVDDESLAASKSATAPANEELGDIPVGGSALLECDIEDGNAIAGLEHCDGAIEELGGDEGLAGALLEAAQVHGTRDDDLPGINGRDLGHRNENASPGLNLDYEAGQSW